jgi:16S rRNA (uracil1498-N3)-methyltransferase
MDLIVRQAAEGGLSEIRPFVSGYSLYRPEKREEREEGRLGRWRRIITEARQQSGSPVATTISPPCDIVALLSYWESLRERCLRPLGIVVHQEPWNLSGSEILPSDSGLPPSPLAQKTFHGYLSNAPDLVVLAIGPEGGFSSAEVSEFLKVGFKTLVMGNTVLRTETAALYAAAAVRIILLENASWMPTTPRL